MVMQSLPGSRQFNLFNWQRTIALLLLGIICFLFILIVQVQHQVRHLETRYANALQKEVELHQDFGKLTLELHHLTALARVEEVATKQLNLTIDKAPDKNNVQTIFLDPLPVDQSATFKKGISGE